MKRIREAPQEYRQTSPISCEGYLYVQEKRKKLGSLRPVLKWGICLVTIANTHCSEERAETNNAWQALKSRPSWSEEGLQLLCNHNLDSTWHLCVTWHISDECDLHHACFCWLADSTFGLFGFLCFYCTKTGQTTKLNCFFFASFKKWNSFQSETRSYVWPPDWLHLLCAAYHSFCQK